MYGFLKHWFKYKIYLHQVAWTASILPMLCQLKTPGQSADCS